MIPCASTQEAVNRGTLDADQLIFATSQSRVILTFNVKDYVLLAQEYAATARPHGGIIVSDHFPFRELLKRTLLPFNAMPTEMQPTHSSGSKITKPITYPLERTCFIYQNTRHQ